MQEGRGVLRFPPHCAGLSPTKPLRGTVQLGLGCLQDKFQVAPLPSWLVLANLYPYKGMHCSLEEGLGEYPSFALSILEHVLSVFFEWEELTDFMNDVKLCLRLALSIVFYPYKD